MCKYCKYIGNDDAWESNKDIFKESLKINGTPFMEIEVYMSDDKDGNPKMVLWVDNGEPCDLIAGDSKKIKYCPFCGRKF